ncbi:MAG TPA: hypothetical protein VET66_11980 [Steroidobacteraceae bacterium]|nr:hypothetical protein [Steroidobacteraceae bacterium]
MSAPLQQVLVAVLVAACALYSAWRLATVRVRLRWLELLATLPGLAGTRWLGQLQARTRAQSTAACGGCSQAAGHKPRQG